MAILIEQPQQVEDMQGTNELNAPIRPAANSCVKVSKDPTTTICCLPTLYHIIENANEEWKARNHWLTSFTGQ